MAIAETIFLNVIKAVAGTIISKGILLALARKGMRPEKWLAKMIHATPRKLDSPLTWVIAGIFGILFVIAWDAIGADGIISRLAPNAVAQSVLPGCSMGNNNTVVGTAPCKLGDGNTILNDADKNGNVIHSHGNEAIGKDSCAGNGAVAIGAGANAGGCLKKP